MNMKEVNGFKITVIDGREKVITDPQSVLDLIMNVKYEADCDRIAINKEAVADAFFVLSSGLAGEVLQKFINYHAKAAIFGDFSAYNSKPLHDFIYESNKGKDIFFVSTEAEALEKLGGKAAGAAEIQK